MFGSRPVCRHGRSRGVIGMIRVGPDPVGCAWKAQDASGAASGAPGDDDDKASSSPPHLQREARDVGVAILAHPDAGCEGAVQALPETFSQHREAPTHGAGWWAPGLRRSWASPRCTTACLPTKSNMLPPPSQQTRCYGGRQGALQDLDGNPTEFGRTRPRRARAPPHGRAACGGAPPHGHAACGGAADNPERSYTQTESGDPRCRL